MQASSLRAVLRLFALLTALGAAANAIAQVNPVGFYLGADLATAHDSNVTQLPSAQGSTIDSAGILAGFNRVYDRQSVLLTVDVARFVYREYSLYNYTSEDVQLHLRTTLPSNVEAELNAVRNQQLAQQADLNTIRRDVIAKDALDVMLRFPVAPDWRAVVGAGGNTLRNSDAIDRPADLDTTEFDIGARYQTGARNYVDLLARELHTTYPNGGLSVFSNTSYRDQALEARTRWRFSGSSSIDGNVGYLKREYQGLTFLDFSGPSWDMTYRWEPLSKTSLLVYLARQEGPAGNNYFSAATTRTYRLTPIYLPTSTLRLEAHYEWAKIDYSSDLNALAAGLSASTFRTDSDTNYGVTLTWSPERWVNVRLEARHEQRSSDIPTFDYSRRVGMLFGSVKF